MKEEAFDHVWGQTKGRGGTLTKQLKNLYTYPTDNLKFVKLYSQPIQKSQTRIIQGNKKVNVEVMVIKVVGCEKSFFFQLLHLICFN